MTVFKLLHNGQLVLSLNLASVLVLKRRGRILGGGAYRGTYPWSHKFKRTEPQWSKKVAVLCQNSASVSWIASGDWEHTNCCPVVMPLYVDAGTSYSTTAMTPITVSPGHEGVDENQMPLSPASARDWTATTTSSQANSHIT